MSEHHKEAKNAPDSGPGSDHWSQGQDSGAESGAPQNEASAPYHQTPAGGHGPGSGYQAAPPYPYPYPYPPHGYYPPPPQASPYWPGAMPPPGYSYAEPAPGPSGNAGQPGMGHAGARHAHGARVSDLVNEVASGGSGLSSLTRMLDLDDIDFWKGALVGAAAVLLLTNGSVQSALFGAGTKTDKTDAAS